MRDKGCAWTLEDLSAIGVVRVTVTIDNVPDRLLETA
jgi:hypothetical protein